MEHEVTGLLAPPGDAPALGAALRRALDEPAATRWAVAGRTRVQAMGDPRRHLEGLLTKVCGLEGEIFEGMPIEAHPPGALACVAVLLGLAAVFTALSNRVLRRRDFAV